MQKLKNNEPGSYKKCVYCKLTFCFSLFFRLPPIPPQCFLYERVRVDRTANTGCKTELTGQFRYRPLRSLQNPQIGAFHVVISHSTVASCSVWCMFTCRGLSSLIKSFVLRLPRIIQSATRYVTKCNMVYYKMRHSLLQSATWFSYYKMRHGLVNTKCDTVYYKVRHGLAITKYNKCYCKIQQGLLQSATGFITKCDTV